MSTENGRSPSVGRWFALAVIVTAVAGISGRVSSSAAAHSGPRVGTAHIPLSFELNQGQSDERVKFLARGNAYTLFLTPSETVLALAAATLPEPGAPHVDPAVVRLRLIGANPDPIFEGLDPLPARSHYFIGRDRQRWRTGVPHYARVGVRNVYPGIDQVFHAAAGELEYDLVVEPGADPSRVRIGFDGVDAVRMNEQGDLILAAGEAAVTQRAPVAYQETGLTRTVVPARYVEKGAKEVAIEIGAYDPRLPLVIDPVLAYSTYLGGSDIDAAHGITVDPAGNSYITGNTTSADFPTVNSLQPLNQRDAFVAKLDPTGSQLVYSTYLGGSTFGDSGEAIAVDVGGNAYVTGITTSSDFPTTSAVQPVYGGGNGDAFVVKLNRTGSALMYSTYIGGERQDRGFGIAVDRHGSAHVTGETWSFNFPTANPLQPVKGGTSLSPDAFLTRLDAAGTAFIYSTYLGGSYYENGNGIALDADGNAYATGYTQSPDFPVANAIQPVMGGPAGAPLGSRTDAFITSVNPAGALLYSTYLGGADHDSARGIAVDPDGNAYVTGSTSATDFPTVNAVQPLNGTPGLYTSTDGGQSWSGLGFNNISVTSVAVDPSNPSTLFVATARNGIFKSTDGGRQWSAANSGLATLSVNEVAIDPLATSTLYAGTSGYKIFKSVDAGNSWVPLPSTPQFVVYTVAFNPRTGTTLHAGMRGQAARSADGGATWTSSGIPSDHIVDFAFDPIDPLVIWAATRDDSPSGGGAYRSSDGGATWSFRSNGLFFRPNLRYFDIPALAIDPVNTSIVYAASIFGVYKTTDSGLNWQPSNAGMTTLDTTSLAINPFTSALYAGTNGGGVFKSIDAGATWTAANAGLGNFRVSVLTVDPTNPSVLYAGTVGHWTDAFLTKIAPGGSTIIYSTYYGGSWNDESRGVAIDGQGSASVAGLTRSLDFPTANAIQPGPGSPSTVFMKDAFVIKFDASGSRLLYSTYLGGSQDDEAFGVAVDRSGRTFVTGQTSSFDFPTTPSAFQPVRGGGFQSAPDAFVVKITR